MISPSACGNEQAANDLEDHQLSGYAPGCRGFQEELRRVIDAWPRLSATVQARIIDLVEGVHGR